jgi:hypothetical protein
VQHFFSKLKGILALKGFLRNVKFTRDFDDPILSYTFSGDSKIPKD